jgi:hypothetical protein
MLLMLDLQIQDQLLLRLRYLHVVDSELSWIHAFDFIFLYVVLAVL